MPDGGGFGSTPRTGLGQEKDWRKTYWLEDAPGQGTNTESSILMFIPEPMS